MAASVKREELRRRIKSGAGSGNKMLFTFASRSENVALARLLAAAVASQREVTIAQLDEVKVAVSEAVSNAIIHGYGSDPERFVEMSIAWTEQELVITVQDDGVGIADVEEAMRPSFSSSTERMGLGFAFMHSFMDAVEVNSTLGEGTSVTLRKALP